MSYEKTVWHNNDIITASKLNKMEEGIAGAGSIATVIVDFNDGGISGSVACYVGYAKYISGQNVYSIESPFTDYLGDFPQARFYIPVLLPPDGDDYKAYIFFNDYTDNMAGYDVSGNISSTKITARNRIDSTHWESTPYYGFEVTGDGEIDVYYDD